MSESDTVQTRGSPTMTESGRDVLGFHLHRFLTPWLEEHDVGVVHVTVGYESSECAPIHLEITPQCCEAIEVEWSFDDLCHAYRYGDGRLCIEHRGGGNGQIVYDVLPVLDRPATGGPPTVVSGYVLLCETEPVSREAASTLQQQTGEALRTARRNGLRMCFEEHNRTAIKPLIYEVMSHLPEWLGCDHSASLLMTSTLETVTLRESSHGRFEVLAERLYADTEEVSAQFDDRLVGMSVDLGREPEHILDRAVARQRRDPDLPYQLYVRTDSGQWRDVQTDRGDAIRDFHRLAREPRADMCVFIPLVIEETPETELLGWLRIGYRHRGELSSSIGEAFADLGTRLASALYFSPLYTLSARKLWLLRRTQEVARRIVDGEEPVESRRERLVDEVTSLIAHHTEVPSLAIGAIERDASGHRQLHYQHPHGWTRFEDVRLPVDVSSENRLDSGVSSLAARLDRPLVLSGGRGTGDDQHFKNHVYVHEPRRRTLDARSPGGEAIERESGWHRLSDYYKPARPRAYATLAYPISFNDEVLGVLTVEVEAETRWVWWTGFGGQLFWETLADELADAFRHLRASS